MLRPEVRLWRVISQKDDFRGVCWTEGDFPIAIRVAEPERLLATRMGDEPAEVISRGCSVLRNLCSSARQKRQRAPTAKATSSYRELFFLL
jgi:hypothetical protein